jgi:hypothetical protein
MNKSNPASAHPRSAAGVAPAIWRIETFITELSRVIKN